MNDMVSGFKILVEQYKDVGGKFLKATAVELFLEMYKKDIVEGLGKTLRMLNPTEVPRMVRENEAFPVPAKYFTKCAGFVDIIEKFPVDRFFEEFLAPASPLVAAAIIDMGDEGADYIVKFKRFFVDSVKAEAVLQAPETEPEPEETEPVIEETEERPLAAGPALRFKVAEATTAEKIVETKPPKMKKLTCDGCGHKWTVPEEEVAAVKECPKCQAPA